MHTLSNMGNRIDKSFAALPADVKELPSAHQLKEQIRILLGLLKVQRSRGVVNEPLKHHTTKLVQSFMILFAKHSEDATVLKLRAEIDALLNATLDRTQRN